MVVFHVLFDAKDFPIGLKRRVESRNRGYKGA